MIAVTELETMFHRTSVGRVSPYKDSIQTPVAEWLQSERKRRQGIAFDSTDGVTPANAFAVVSAIRKVAKEAGWKVQCRVLLPSGEAPRVNDRKIVGAAEVMVACRCTGTQDPNGTTSEDTALAASAA
jgi:hypothetical protein